MKQLAVCVIALLANSILFGQVNSQIDSIGVNLTPTSNGIAPYVHVVVKVFVNVTVNVGRLRSSLENGFGFSEAGYAFTKKTLIPLFRSSSGLNWNHELVAG